MRINAHKLPTMDIPGQFTAGSYPHGLGKTPGKRSMRMFDTRRALTDMANQIRTCRGADGLTLQQLATRSGVAASTIHKVEAQQMVPTVSVLLKIAKGLGRRPEELICDQIDAESADNDGLYAYPASNGNAPSTPDSLINTASRARPNVGVWQIDLSHEKKFPVLDLDPRQRAIVLVERGEVDLQAGDQRIQMDAGDCIEVEGGRIQSRKEHPESASLMLIVSPPGNLHRWLGEPRPSAPIFS